MARWKRVNLDKDSETPKGFRHFRALVWLNYNESSQYEVFLDAFSYATALKRLKTEFSIKEIDITLVESWRA